MASRTVTNSTGQARGSLMRLERQQSQAEMNLKSATRNRIVGGVILLISVAVLIQFSAVIGVVGLLIGGFVFYRAHTNIGEERHAIDTIGDRVTIASAKLNELNSQPSGAD